jgi:hypothetical protein
VPANRPHIPSELERRVLVEAGHRCAIPTCRNTPVDLAHIEPWAKVREHRFENLITLCPTCHRRYDRGEIDRLSMLAYKEQLQPHARRQRSQLIASYCALRAALDAWDRTINGLVHSNVITPGLEEVRQLRRTCIRERQSARLVCMQFATVSSWETARIAEHLLARYESLADHADDGLLPSTHLGADRHDDIDGLEDELLTAVSEEAGMSRGALSTLARPRETLGGTGKRF